MVVRNLLVPTDFSEKALSSLEYALAFARDIGASVHVLNSYYIPVATIDADYVADQALWLEQSRQRALEEMELLEKQYMQPAGVPYSCMVHPGPAMSDINETIDNTNIDLLVMGAYDTGQLSGFFGDFYSYAVRNAKAPALLIPDQYPYAFPKNVVFAADLKPFESPRPLEFARNLFCDMKPEIRILHVHKAGEKPDNKKEQELRGMLEFFGECNVHPVLLESDDTEEAVLRYASDQNPDWLMAVTHRYGFLDKLFHSSHTKKFARHASLPLLVLRDR